jgi:Rrf2 family protein
MLRLSTKSRYASRMLVYLAINARDRPANTQEIAKAEGISKDYVEQILTRLRTAGVVTSHRGIKGGFSIAKDPEKITVKEIVELTEGKISIAPCIKDDCDRSSLCATQVVWSAANKAIEETLAAFTVQDLCQMTKDNSESLSFQI